MIPCQFLRSLLCNRKFFYAYGGFIKILYNFPVKMINFENAASTKSILSDSNCYFVP